ncbi:MAG: hypothetical protein GY948_20235 [Alphaproteobacteria bacterium]|nr:hypothetical protein [Alphaproteobacteria bacterium]
MRTASDMRRFLGKLILVLFMVIHAPVSGVMTAVQAGTHGDPAGAGMMVICLDGNFAQIEAPDGPRPNSTGGHECLCPCATLGAKSVLDARPSPSVLILREREPGRVNWIAEAGPFLAPPPQSGRGSPRSPPFSII